MTLSADQTKGLGILLMIILFVATMLGLLGMFFGWRAAGGTLIFVAAVCFVTAVLDGGMNGSRDAGWLPVGFALSVVCGALAWWCLS